MKEKLLRLIRTGTTRSATWLVSGTLLQAISAFIANAVLTRFLLPEEFGRFAIATANISLVKAVVSFPISTLIVRASNAELDEKLNMYTAVNAVQGLLIFIGSIFLLIQFKNLNLYSFVLLLSVISSSWVNIEKSLYERQFTYKKLSLVETLAWLLGHAVSIIGVFAGLGPFVLYFRDLVRQSVLLVGISFFHGLQPLSIRVVSLPEWKQVIEEVKGFWANRFLENSFDRIVVLVIGVLAGEKGAGYFFQAQRFALLPFQLLYPVTSRMAMNYFSHRASQKQGAKLLLTTIGWAVCLTLPVALIMAFFANPVIPVLLGPGWEPVVPIFVAMLGVIVMSNPFELLKAYFVAQGDMKTLVVFGRGGQYLAFSLGMLLVKMGLMQPAVGLALGLSASCLVPTLFLFGQLAKKQFTQPV